MRALLVPLAALLAPLPASPSDPVSAPWPGLQDDRSSGWSDYFALPDFNLPVYALAVHEGRLFLGGAFSYLGPQALSALAAWDGRTFEPVGLSGTVTAIVADGSDLILGGRFEWDETGRHLVARWNGTSFEPLGELGNAMVTALVLWNDTLVASGTLRAGGVWPRHAWFDGSEWHPMPAAGPGDHTLRVHRGELYAVRNSEVKRWVHPERWEVAFTADGPVAELLSLGDDLLAGGGFTTIEGVPAERLARFDGETWTEFAGGVQGYSYDVVRALRDLGDGRLFVGGNFRSVGGMDSYNSAIWNGTSWEPIGQGTSMFFRDAVGYDGDLVASGTLFRCGDGDAMRVARWDGQAWRALTHEGQGIGVPWNRGARVNVLLATDRQIWAGGTFGRAGGLDTPGIARFDGTEWHALGKGLSHTVNALAIHRGDLVAGGEIARSGQPGEGPELHNVGLWNGTAWEPLGGGLSREVQCLASQGEDLFACTAPPTDLWRWDGAGWSVAGGPFDGPVNVLLESDGRVIAGGAFTHIGSEEVANLASWDGERFEAVGGGTDGAVHDVATYRGELVVGGDFDTAGGEAFPRLARWNGTSWRGFDESLISAWTVEGTRIVEYRTSVREVAAIGGHLYVAGAPLVGTESVPAGQVIRWSEDERRWTDLDGGVPGWSGCSETIRTFAGFGGDVLLGGSFDEVGDAGMPSFNVAAWRPRPGGAERIALGSGTAGFAPDLRAFPNPFRGRAALAFRLPVRTAVHLTIHDVQGRLVTELTSGPQSAGGHLVRWDGADRFGRRVPAGVYFVRLERDGAGTTLARKIVRLD